MIDEPANPDSLLKPPTARQESIQEIASHPRIVISQDGLTNGFQLSIEASGLGFRIAGPKFCGRSKELLVKELTEQDAKEIMSYLRLAYPRL